MTAQPPKTILIIDDEEQIRKMLRQMIEKNGYNVFEASDGGEGLQCVKHNHIDLIITDIFMPGKEGIETIIELKRDYPDITIFAMSGGGSVGPETFLKITNQLGVVETFTKPIDRKALLHAIDTLFTL